MLENLEVEIKPFFTSNEIENLARDAGFVQRYGKINGEVFLNLIIFHNENLKEQSLEHLSGILKHDYKIIIVKQSLNERFNKYATDFLKNALKKLLHKQLIEIIEYGAALIMFSMNIVTQNIIASYNT